jgi:hypothetical protein
MTLGTYSDLTERLDTAEAYGFQRGFFPWSYNSHSVVLMQNDGYVADDGRLFLHLSLVCELCGYESKYRGKLSEGAEHAHIQTVKMLALLPYHKCDCKP